MGHKSIKTEPIIHHSQPIIGVSDHFGHKGRNKHTPYSPSETPKGHLQEKRRKKKEKKNGKSELFSSSLIPYIMLWNEDVPWKPVIEQYRA